MEEEKAKINEGKNKIVACMNLTFFVIIYFGLICVKL